jgi:DNA replication protein DnaC
MNSIGSVASKHFRPPFRLDVACPNHPEVKRLECDPCLAAAQERSTAAERLDLIRVASESCDRRIPFRYRRATPDHPKVEEWVSDYLRNPTDAGDLMLMGTVGTGKTWQAFGAIRSIATTPIPCRTGGWVTRSWRHGTHADLIAALRPSFGVDSEQVMASYLASPILVIDDLAMAKESDWAEESIYRIIGGRYNDQKTTIYTTNLIGEQLAKALGERIASRLKQSCRCITFRGNDRRRES